MFISIVLAAGSMTLFLYLYKLKLSFTTNNWHLEQDIRHNIKNDKFTKVQNFKAHALQYIYQVLIP